VSTFLLEIGTEELPADFARLAVPQLQQQVMSDLAAQRLQHGAVHCTSTPRRLVVLVEQVAAKASDLEDERKGPPAEQAFKDGAPTQAAIGFARRCGIAPEALEIRPTPKGDFVFATVRECGRPSIELLAGLIPQWIQALQGRRFMRWGVGESRFSRPVRWLVALLGQELIPVTLAGSDPQVSSDRWSRGHRLHAGTVAIPSAEEYKPLLAASGVQVDRLERRAAIRSQVDAAAAALQARSDLPSELLEELTDLVEAPLVFQGSIRAQDLHLPAEVLVTVMQSHQRYVPLLHAQRDCDPLALDATDILLPQFLCVGNGLPAATETVRRGNERVLKARLADAEFFVKADRAVASIDRRDLLARVTFAEGLGSLLDRVERMEWLCDVLLDQLNLPQVCAEAARRATHLCKHDLVSQMVGEFPELQGVMGGKYLLAEGEPRPVAQAVQEHYLPKGAGDALPGSEPGAVVAAVERLELLLSIFAKGERPSGSSDPYALRRAGNGVLQILWNRGWSLDLSALLVRAINHWSQLLPHCSVQSAALAVELGEFLRQRIVSLLEEEGFPPDLVQAVAGEGLPLERILSDPGDARRRLELLVALRHSGSLSAVEAVVTRAARLADKSELPLTVLAPRDVVRPELFEKASEAAMLAVLGELEPLALAGAYADLAQGLSAGADTLAAFFDGDQSVMVMVDDPEVRANRLNLLAVLRNQASVLADFNRISG
jgi:glycyl-tRNA synthetase beta chain